MTSPADQFWEVAVRERFVTEAVANDASTIASSRGWTAEQAARDHVALNQAVIGIIQALLHPRDQVPGYELLGHLGHGGMGVVYRARQLAFDRTVALKTVLVGPDANASALQRFEQEARTIGRLIHPHLVTAYDFTRVGGRYALAMEFLDGRDAERWRQGRFVSERQVWGLIRQAAAGLAYAANAGVIHRDIKPSNLLLVPPPLGFPLPPGVPLLKVADFGLALLQDASASGMRITQENSTVGSPLYMAPEQLMGSRVDHRADIYALGGTAYFLFTGESPFEGLTMQQIFAQKLHGTLRPVETLCPDMSRGGSDLVHCLLERDADRRPASYEVIFQRIDELLLQLPADEGHSLAETSDSVPVSVGTDPFQATQVVGVVGTRALDETPNEVESLAVTAVTAASQRTAATVDTVPSDGAGERGSNAAPSVMTRRKWLAVGGMLLASAGAAGWGLRRPQRMLDWIPSGWENQCFDGRTLNGWQTESGIWIPGVPGVEEGAVMACSQGAIVYHTVRIAEGRAIPLQGYRLIALVQPRDSQAAEVHWAIAAEGKREAAPRYVIRLAGGKVQVGTRSSHHGPLTTVLASRNLPANTGRYEVKLEVHGAPTRVYFNGAELVTVAPPSYAVSPEILLAVEPTEKESDKASAWFSDIAIEELQPPPSPSPK